METSTTPPAARPSRSSSACSGCACASLTARRRSAQPAGRTAAGSARARSAAAAPCSRSRMCGTSSAAKVAAAPMSPPAMSVPRTPIAAATGPVSAKLSGSSPIEISQSRLERGPASIPGHPLLDGRPDDRAGRLERVERQARQHQLPERGREAVADDRERRRVQTTYMNVMKRRGSPRWPMTIAQPPSPTRRRRRRGRDRRGAAEVVLDEQRDQDLDRPHEAQVGHGGARERRPQPDVAPDVAPALEQVARDEDAPSGAAAARRAHASAARPRRSGRTRRRAGTRTLLPPRRSARRRAPDPPSAGPAGARAGRARWPARARSLGSSSGTIASNAGAKNAAAVP